MRLSSYDTGFTSGFSYKVNSVTAGDVITLPDTKNFCKVSTSDDDALIAVLIEAMIDNAERFTGLSFRTKSLTLEFQQYGSQIPLPFGPHTAVSAVRTKYHGDETTLSADDYFVTGQDYYTLNLKQLNGEYGLEVDVTAGYGHANVPALIKLALYKAVLSNYEDRQDLIAGSVMALPNESKELLRPYRRVRI